MRALEAAGISVDRKAACKAVVALEAVTHWQGVAGSLSFLTDACLGHLWFLPRNMLLLSYPEVLGLAAMSKEEGSPYSHRDFDFSFLGDAQVTPNPETLLLSSENGLHLLLVGGGRHLSS